MAAFQGDVSTLTALPYKDPSIDQALEVTGSCAGWRPIIIAAAEGKADAVKMLLAKGADPNVTNLKGRTALMFAARYGYDTIVDDLLNAGANPNLVPLEGPKAIVAAGMEGHARAILSILKRGGTITARDCEPKNQDGCVRIGMVLGALLFDNERAKEINAPFCDQGYQRSCAIVAAASCLLKFTENGKAPSSDQQSKFIESCLPPEAKKEAEELLQQHH